MKYYAVICALTATIFVNTLVGAAKIPNLKSIHYGFDGHFIKQKKTTDLKSVPFQRKTRLYSKASGQHLQIINGTVNGLGEEGSEFATLKVLSDTFGRVKILGAKTNRFLCMNKYGRLVGRKKNGNKEKRKKCIFRERETSTGYRLYESVKYPKWFIAINKKGRAVPGPLSTMRKKNRQFLPRDYLKPTRTRKRNYRGRARGFSRRQRMKKLKRRRQRKAFRKRKSQLYSLLKDTSLLKGTSLLRDTP